MGNGGTVNVEKPDDDQIVLGLLDAVHGNSRVSQRSLANELGIALGLTNAYLRRCVRKGLVKVRKAPPHRYVYYLTPQGFAEKSRLTASYLKKSLGFYRTARNEIDGLLDACVACNRSRLSLCGPGDLAEIAVLCATRYPVQVEQVFGPEARDGSFMGLPMVRKLEDLASVDAFLITDMERPQAMFEMIRAHAGPDRVVAPALLRIGQASGEPRS